MRGSIPVPFASASVGIRVPWKRPIHRGPTRTGEAVIAKNRKDAETGVTRTAAAVSHQPLGRDPQTPDDAPSDPSAPVVMR